MGQRSGTHTTVQIFAAFQERSAWTQAQLSRRVGVGVRALRRVLEDMRTSGLADLRDRFDHPHVVWEWTTKKANSSKKVMRKAPAEKVIDAVVPADMWSGPRGEYVDAQKGVWFVSGGGGVYRDGRRVSKGDLRALSAASGVGRWLRQQGVALPSEPAELIGISFELPLFVVAKLDALRRARACTRAELVQQLILAADVVSQHPAPAKAARAKVHPQFSRTKAAGRRRP